MDTMKKYLYSLLNVVFAITMSHCAPTRHSNPNYRCLANKAAMNGVLEIGCWGFKECVNGTLVEHLCAENTVLERDTMTCITPGTGHTDCNMHVLCLYKGDGYYAARGDNCQTHYRCFVGRFMGRLYCPANLVFNEEIRSCDYPYNVAPPCGTRTEPSIYLVTPYAPRHYYHA